MFINLASVINEVMSCTGVIKKAMDQKQSTEFTALVYAAINSFNIDDSENFIVTKWYFVDLMVFNIKVLPFFFLI